jgi:hypothetical protein
MLNHFAVLVPVIVYPVEVAHIPVELVIAQFETYELQDQQAGGHPNRQTGYINKRK